MSAVRKIFVSVATLFLGVSGMFLLAGTASADNPWESPAPAVDNPWESPKPGDDNPWESPKPHGDNPWE